MLQRATYSGNGDLVDEDGTAWQRVVDWLEPDEAAIHVAAGLPYLVEWRAATPVRGRPERFEHDILRAMVTRGQADRLIRRVGVSALMVGELWHSTHRGDCLVFVEQDP
ncbi:MAG TPA: hypothetical protein VFP34_13570 [Microlunatus sp.]|nr:hypothetical protein [Microlunatus sp.]